MLRGRNAPDEHGRQLSTKRYALQGSSPNEQGCAVGPRSLPSLAVGKLLTPLAIASLVFITAAGCGGSTVAVARPKPTAPAPPPIAESEPDPLPQVRVRGLTGTLNKDDVHQTMDARQEAFDQCIHEVRRRQAWVEGTIRFDFKVDGHGKVEAVSASSSTIGHRPLERCLTQVVSATEFPRPAGRATAQFSWDMHVEPAYRPADPMDAGLLSRVLRKKARDVFRGCKVRRFRNRFQVTAYVGRRGRILAAGAIPNRPQPDEKVDCVIEEIRSWRLPKPKRLAKVSFRLR